MKFREYYRVAQLHDSRAIQAEEAWCMGQEAVINEVRKSFFTDGLGYTQLKMGGTQTLIDLLARFPYPIELPTGMENET